jgi:hypothetical protein
MKELIFWVLALGLLAIATPEQYGHAHHFTLCPLANLGMEWCPGCGLGRSLVQLLHGNIVESWKYHWFGIPALIIIVFRIAELIKWNIKLSNIKYKEKKYV